MSTDFDEPLRPIVDSPPIVVADHFDVTLLDPVDACRHRVLQASLRVERGTFTAIIGASGSGKTTLALGMSGLLPSTARVKFRSLEIDSQRCWNPDRIEPVSAKEHSDIVLGQQRDTFFYLSQNARSALVPFRSVRWHVETAKRHGRLRHLPNANGQDPASRLSTRLARYFCVSASHTDRLLQKQPHQLSTGECQRVLFAIAMELNPKVLIADEPFASLDSASADTVFDDLLQYVREGGAVLLVTHQLGLLRKLPEFSTAMVMDQGAVIDQLPVSCLLDGGPVTLRTAKLLQSGFRPPPTLSAQDSGDTILSVRGLSKKYENRTIFDNQNFSIPAGSRVGIEGPSGRGKTTLARILIGLEKQDSGSVTRFGQPDSDWISSRRKRLSLWRRMQLVSQDSDLVFDPHEMVGESITRAVSAQISRRSRQDSWEIAQRIFARTGMSGELMHAPPHRLSGGEKKRAAICRSLALLGYDGLKLESDIETGHPNQTDSNTIPRILLLDEPTVGLDVFHQGRLAEWLVEVQRHLSLSIVVFSHDVNFLERFCDRRMRWPNHDSLDEPQQHIVQTGNVT